MNALTHFSAKSNLQSIPSLNNHRAIIVRPVLSLSFTSQPRTPYVPIKASSSSSPGFSVAKVSNPEETFNDPAIRGTQFQIPLSLVKCAVVTTVTATALFLSKFCFRVNPAIAFPVSAPATVDTGARQAVSDAKTEKVLEEHLLSNPNDVEALKSLLEIRLQNRKIGEAFIILNRLMEVEPSEAEWPILKNHLYVLTGAHEKARTGFNEILAKDPLRVEAYHGLITAISEEDQVENLKGIEKRILEAMGLCNNEDMKDKLRDFKLLLAEICAIGGEYEEALKFYQELAKEEPMDFRPHLSQAIMYTLLGKDNEAQRHFQNGRKLVPKGHPYESYLEDGFTAAKLLAAKK